MLTVPPAILDVLQLTAGSTVGISINHGCLVVDPHPTQRYTLDQLLAQCDASADISAEDRQWSFGSPVGRELL